MLEVRSVTVRFGGHVALDDVTLEAADATITGLIGPNGAGKTTMFDVITGLRRPRTGTVALDGRNLGNAAPHRRARAGLARTFQSLQLFGTLTVHENLLLGVPDGARRARDAAADELVGFLGLDAHRDELAQSLPTGTGRRVELGFALAARPRFLLLDEPASGQSAEETAAFKDLLRLVTATGVGVLLVEHDVPLVMDMCSTIHVLDFGRLIASGPPDSIRDDPAVQAAYLGVATEVRVNPLLELRDICAGYGSLEVLHEVSVAVHAGDLLVVLGPNGAGKTTMLNVAAGIIPPTSGDVLIGGAPMTGVDPGDLARAGLCSVPEGRAVFPNLTVQENLLMMTHTGQPAEAIEERAYAHFPQLAQRRQQLAGSMSGGEQQMLAIARPVSTAPAVLLVDELSMGLAPIVVAHLFEVVATLASEGTSIVMVEQFADAALEIATTAAVMAGGRIAATGPPDQIRTVIHEAYLGAAR